MRFRDRIARFMYGRRGTDELSRFLLIVTIVLIVLSWVTGEVIGSLCWAAAILALGYCYFRILSRNIYKREKENGWYLRKKRAVAQWFRSLKDRWQQRKEYKFFRCPSCKTLLRVPRGKGKLILTCCKCGNRFERKT